MKFRHLALKNVKGNWYKYIAFFLSCTFSVVIFYMFASFIYHPDVVNGQMFAAGKVRTALLACEYIIIIFSFFFVLYSESAFVKSRRKEFGLLTLFGMTQGLIRKLVFYENMLIAVLSIFSGLVLGTLFSKLFLMAMSALLQVTSPIAFQIVPKAVLITVVGFLALFFVITVYSLFRMGQSDIIDLLKAAQKPKKLPLFSKWLVGVAILCLAVGYGMAVASTENTIVLLMLPILGVVVVGTYFLFTQGSVAFFRRMRKRTSIYYNKTNLITFSQMIFKMKDNARVLFMVSILSAVVLTASGTFYVFFQGLLSNVTAQYPQTMSFVEQGIDTHDVIAPEKVDKILKDNNVEKDFTTKISGIPVPIDLYDGTKTVLVSEDAYNQAAEKMDIDKIHVDKGHGVFAYAGPGEIAPFEKNPTFDTKVNEEDTRFHIDKQTDESVANWPFDAESTVIINNQEYDKMAASVDDDKKMVSYGYELKDWISTEDTIDKIKSEIPKSQKAAFQSKVEPYVTAKQLGSLTMFIGLFVSLLFFTASGSMIYFKLFTELQEDQQQFRSLRRIGMTTAEIKKIVTRQIGMIFFVPFVVGGIHALFAFKMLANLGVFSGVWVYGGTVIGIFFGMQLIYFFITRQSYLSRIVITYKPRSDFGQLGKQALH